MDIVCKECGKNVDNHPDDFGMGGIGNCKFSQSDVYKIYITEQQARLDTIRMQLERIIPERNKLKNIIGKKLRGSFHSIIGNLHDKETILNICDTALRIIENE